MNRFSGAGIWCSGVSSLLCELPVRMHPRCARGKKPTHLPLLKMTVQLGQQSWLAWQRLGKIPTPTACSPLWSLRVKALQLI